MNAVTETKECKPLDLATLRANPELYFEDETVTLERLKQAVEAENDSFNYDLSKDKSRKEIISFSRQCSTLKTAVDAAGKERVAAIKEKANAVDTRRKAMREYLDEQRDARRKPLTDWEEQEEARIASHRAIIEDMIQSGYVGFNESPESIQQRIDKIAAVDVSEAALQEFAENAASKKAAILQSLNTHLQQARHNEEQALKLQQLEAEKAEQEQLAAEEREKREVEDAKRREEEEQRLTAEREKAEAERIEREKAEAATKAAEDAKREAEENAKREREQLLKQQEEAAAKRKADEEAKRQAEEARAANLKHREALNQEAQKAIMTAGKIGDERASKIVQAIAAGSVPHVSIKY
ncbi:hypothetical protein [Pseudovibrio sp. Ad26]|uniref:hypothetical protein n=1 Tax=Pseudovibrio sp. Ad26 TaxID=989410 RepID=UPI0007AE7D0E|nr:hypothetical protein [Pseudovibrio sp. Ad26]KZL10672.1 hypothetical protein PsAD26_03036 [Pseudovibrio sp. Ad26]